MSTSNYTRCPKCDTIYAASDRACPSCAERDRYAKWKSIESRRSTGASGNTAKLMFSYKLSASLASREKASRAVQQAFAEFDARYPGRRVGENAVIEFKDAILWGVLRRPSIRVPVSVRCVNTDDAIRLNAALDETFAKHGLGDASAVRVSKG